MKHESPVPCAAVGLIALALAATTAAAGTPDPAAADQASKILQTTGVTGGLIVDLGCGSGKLAAALRAGPAFTVQGLDTKADDVVAARKYIQSLGLYGPVSVELLSGSRLPYVDNLVRLVVVEDVCGVSMDEVMRVLAPLGAAYVKQGGQWVKTVKPWPKGMDDWQQHFHDADNNAVAHDELVGPPRRYQWIAQPEWQRSHLSLPTINDFVSSKGRLFTIEDQGSAEHPALPGEYTLVARDAFNGIVLWQRRFPDWWPVNRAVKFTPVQIQRRLVAAGDTVYATPGYSAAVTAFDAATGKVLKTYKGTERTTEFVYDGGVLFVVVGDPTDVSCASQVGGRLSTSAFAPRRYGPEIPDLADPKSTIVAIDAKTGRTLWRKTGTDTEGYEGSSLAVRGSRAVYATKRELVCLDRTTGKQIWRVAAPVVMPTQPGVAVALVLSDKAAYLADAEGLRAFSLADGSKLWTGNAGMNHFKAPDLFLTGGLVWADAQGGKNPGRIPTLLWKKLGPAGPNPAEKSDLNADEIQGHDPLTGRIVKTLAQKMTGPMVHDRCYRNRITDRYYINTKTGGSDFLDFTRRTEYADPWVRSTCGIGPLPCNGLLYVGPHSCSCCNWVMLKAMNALAPDPSLKSPDELPDVPIKPRLEKGPAYGQTAAGPDTNAGDWPTYRHDARRSGVTRSAAPAALRTLWQAKVTTNASAPVIAEGKVFVADVDAHAVCAFDAADGHLLWRFTTGGRVDSPPTWFDGLLLFGSRDGVVYALRASDGVLAWRFRALPDDRMICAYGQVESAWPVCGSIMVKDGPSTGSGQGVAYFAAGRDSFLDGGIFLFGLDPRTGRVIHERRMYGPYKNGYPIITNHLISGFGTEGLKADVFLTDGNLLYLRQQAFRSDLTPLDPLKPCPPHLIPSPGFLEQIPQHRTFWTIDTTIRYDISAGKQPVHGDILVQDGKKYYEVRGYTPGRMWPFDPRVAGYTLYAGQILGLNEPASPGGAKKSAGGARVLNKNTRRGRKAGANGRARLRPGSAPGIEAREQWASHIPLTGKAMALAGDTLFVAGTPVVFPANDLAAAYEGRKGGVLWAASAETGKKSAEVKLDAPPVWDGMAVANGKLFIALQDGRILCMGGK